jgi:hypothetical protein
MRQTRCLMVAGGLAGINARGFVGVLCCNSHVFEIMIPTIPREGGVTLDGEGPCGKWMPRKMTHCARKSGHGGACKTSESMARAVERKAESVRVNGRRRYPETKRRWRQVYKLWRYGLTQEQFDRLLTVQENACGMCRELFAEGRPICVDHDHTCCPGEKVSCGKCVRGLLCRSCNTGLGHIERKSDLARVYLANFPARLLAQRGVAVSARI